tara:strand:- start:1284 stop:1640 length:357 start_codon:yes stop_codon:yes gene_type:complete
MSTAQTILEFMTSLEIKTDDDIRNVENMISALQSYARGVRAQLDHQAEAEFVWELIAQNAYTPHQYVGGFDETFNPDHWIHDPPGYYEIHQHCTGNPGRTVFSYARLPPPADRVLDRV